MVARKNSTSPATTKSSSVTRPATCGDFVAIHADDEKFADRIKSRDVTCRRLPMHSGDCRVTLKAPTAPKVKAAPKPPTEKQLAARAKFAAAAKARHEASVARNGAAASKKAATAKPTGAVAAPKGKVAPEAAPKVIPMGKGRAPKERPVTSTVTTEQKRAIGLLVEAGVLTPSSALEMIAALA